MRMIGSRMITVAIKVTHRDTSFRSDFWYENVFEKYDS